MVLAIRDFDTLLLVASVEQVVAQLVPCLGGPCCTWKCGVNMRQAGGSVQILSLAQVPL